MRARTGIFLLVLHLYRLSSTTGPLGWKSAEENESNAWPFNHHIITSRQSHLSRIVGRGVRAVGVLSQQAEHTRSMRSALRLSTALDEQKLDQRGRHVEGG